MPLPPDDPVLAVVSPPRLERFRELAGIGPDDVVTADFGGWSKLVLLTRDLALLFPRNHDHVEPLQWELEALRVVAQAGLAEIPEVVAVWQAKEVSPYPVVAVRRLSGTILEGLLEELDADVIGHVLEQVGRMAARWHGVAAGPLLARPPRNLDHREGIDALLGTAPRAPDPAEEAGHLRQALGLDAAAEGRARSALARARTLAPVVVHSDIHEAQLLVDPENGFNVTGIIDWQTARVDHPFTELDLGEWGPTIWRMHRATFPALRRRYWNAYAAARSLPDSLGPVFEWIWCVSHALWLVRERPDAARAEVTGTLEEALGRVADATRELPD